MMSKKEIIFPFSMITDPVNFNKRNTSSKSDVVCVMLTIYDRIVSGSSEHCDFIMKNVSNVCRATPDNWTTSSIVIASSSLIACFIKAIFSSSDNEE